MSLLEKGEQRWGEGGSTYDELEYIVYCQFIVRSLVFPVSVPLGHKIRITSKGPELARGLYLIIICGNRHCGVNPADIVAYLDSPAHLMVLRRSLTGGRKLHLLVFHAKARYQWRLTLWTTSAGNTNGDVNKARLHITSSLTKRVEQL